MQEDMVPWPPWAAHALAGAAAPRQLERNVVVRDLEVVRRRTLLASTRRSAAATAPRAALATAAQEHEARVRPADPHAHALARVAVLVLVLVRPDRPLDVDLATLAHVVAHHLGGLAEHLDVVPLGVFLL